MHCVKQMKAPKFSALDLRCKARIRLFRTVVQQSLPFSGPTDYTDNPARAHHVWCFSQVQRALYRHAHCGDDAHCTTYAIAASETCHVACKRCPAAYARHRSATRPGGRYAHCAPLPSLLMALARNFLPLMTSVGACKQLNCAGLVFIHSEAIGACLGLCCCSQRLKPLL